LLEQQFQNYDRRVIVLSLLFYFLIATELSVIHHLGHNIVCATEGYEFNILINPFGGYSTCYGVPKNSLAYTVLGPAFGMLASGLPLMIPTMRRNKIWLIALLALFSNEALKVPIEITVRMPSEVPPLHIGMLLFQYSILFGLILFLARKKNMENNISVVKGHL
jgi:hypothetical protein